MTTLAQLKEQTDEYIASCNMQESQHISINGMESIIYASDKNKVYIPTATGAIFHSDDSFIRLLMGPYGSGKSTACLNELVRRSINMPKWSNGRRRSRWGIIRNTSGELYSTTLQSWLMWFGELGDINKRQKPILTYEHVFNDGHGLVEIELVFLALDREDDLRKIKSLEFTGVYINELSEVPQGALAHLKGRVNHRYPSREFCPAPYWSGIICDTNPPDVDHWIFRDFELANNPSYKIFKQPPGLIKTVDNTWMQNPECDNYRNLAHDYYTLLAEGQTEDFVKVFCLGEYGSVGFGKKVYPEYNDDLHSVENIEAIQGQEIHLGFDFGLTPSCVVVQISERGQLRVLKEYFAEDMGIRTFAESIVIPSLKRDFPYCPIGKSIADPAGIAKNQIYEAMSCIGELNALGLKTEPASTNDIEPRLAAVRYFLNRMADGKPSFVINKHLAPILRVGFIKHYIYKRIAVGGEARYKEKPDKNKWSHTHDALQYICLELSNAVLNPKNNKPAFDMFNPGFRYL